MFTPMVLSQCIYFQSHTIMLTMQSLPIPFSEYIFSFATSATKKISDSIGETAQTIKKSVEEGNIDGFIDKACCPFSLFDKFGSKQKKHKPDVHICMSMALCVVSKNSLFSL